MENDFCKQYEIKQIELNLLYLVKDDLTATGLDAYKKISMWLLDNHNKYEGLKFKEINIYVPGN